MTKTPCTVPSAFKRSSSLKTTLAYMGSNKAATGQTPYHYLMELRLAKAQSMLMDRALPLTDIALACGFSSHAHLSTAFRARFGVAPSAYRRDR